MSRTLTRSAIRAQPEPRWTRSKLASLLHGQLEGQDGIVERLSDPRDAGPDDVVFVRFETYLEAALQSSAGLIVLGEGIPVPAQRNVLRVAQPEVAWAELLAAFAPQLETPAGVHPSASVHPEAQLEPGVHLGPNVTVARGARIGAGSVIMAGGFVGEGSRLGMNCVIHPNSTILHQVHLGDRVLVQAGAVIGSDGFGFRRTSDHQHERLTHIGGVTIEDDVEIGANSVIDRGTVGHTRIGARSKIGPACIIAHNGSIGEDVILIGAVQVAGSVTIQDRALIWGQVGVAGHLTIGAGAIVTGQSGVTKDLEPGVTYRGTPARPMRAQMRTEARTQDLDGMHARLVELERKLALLEGKTRED